MAAFVLVLLLVMRLNYLPRAKATRMRPLVASPSSSQTLKDLHDREKSPYKKMKSSFRRIPPSRSNPTQNKLKPP
ncbi:UNVERIFIED_CONTAM: hypothetical protein Sindi_1217300 [Sesamum indicum]